MAVAVFFIRRLIKGNLISIAGYQAIQLRPNRRAPLGVPIGQEVVGDPGAGKRRSVRRGRRNGNACGAVGAWVAADICGACKGDNTNDVFVGIAVVGSSGNAVDVSFRPDAGKVILVPKGDTDTVIRRIRGSRNRAKTIRRACGERRLCAEQG